MSPTRFVFAALALAPLACGSPPQPVVAPPANSAPAPVASAPAVDPYDRPVPFETGFTSPSAGDDIHIDAIRGDRPDFTAGGTYRVHGHYTLQSRPTADLMVWVTNGDLSGDKRQVEVARGDGTFDLAFTLTKMGWPHVSFYPVGGGDGFGGVYFGHEATLNPTTPPTSDMICYPDAAKKLGWILSGGGAKGGDFCVSPDDAATRSGRTPARLKKRPHGNSFAYGTLMKEVDAAPYLGKRVRVSIDVRTDEAKGRRDIWARVQSKSSPGDGAGLGGAWVTLDETSDFATRSIVLDVPLNATRLEYGVGLGGSGAAWLDNDSVTVVDPSVPLTEPPPTEVGGWWLLGIGRADYAIATDPSAKRGALLPVEWKSATTAASKRYAALTRVLPALDVRGKRIKVTRWVRTKDAESMACFTKIQREPSWTYGPVLAYDFETLPPTRAWAKCESVIDVDVEAAWILTGVTGRGAGETWVDDAKVEVVPMTTPLTLRTP
jgi:hypothetical protein